MNKRKNKSRPLVAGTIENLSPAEQAFLSGDGEALTGWCQYFYWCLKHGEESWYKGRAITPWELVEHYGHLVSPSRLKELQAEVAALKYHSVFRGGEMVRELRPEFREKEAPPREPWVVPLRAD